jgi:hypothetical protein
MSGPAFPEDPSYRQVLTGLHTGPMPDTGTLLLQLPDQGALPMLQVYDGTASYIKLVRRWRRGPRPIEHETVWLDIDVGHGPFEVVEPRPREDILADIRAFLGDDPRADALIACLPKLPW